MLLDRLAPLLQAAQLGGEREVSSVQLGIGGSLRFELALQIPSPQPSAATKPQRPLDRQQQSGQDNGQRLHVVSVQVAERAPSCIAGHVTQILLDPEQL